VASRVCGQGVRGHLRPTVLICSVGLSPVVLEPLGTSAAAAPAGGRSGSLPPPDPGGRSGGQMKPPPYTHTPVRSREVLGVAIVGLRDAERQWCVALVCSLVQGEKVQVKGEKYNEPRNIAMLTAGLCLMCIPPF
jgi:hypothetical protein